MLPGSGRMSSNLKTRHTTKARTAHLTPRRTAGTGSLGPRCTGPPWSPARQVSLPSLAQPGPWPGASEELTTIIRDNGYLRLSSYGLLADGHAGALVAADGSVDWFAAPRLDAPPVCAALLDPDHGGAITLAPTVDYRATQRYIDDTMVLETTFRAESGTVVVTDALTGGAAGELPWRELARRVEAKSGHVPMRWQVRPGHRLGTARPWVHRRNGVPVFEAGQVQLAVLTDAVGTAQITDQAAGAQFVARAVSAHCSR
jgi:trehalase-like protein